MLLPPILRCRKDGCRAALLCNIVLYSVTVEGKNISQTALHILNKPPLLQLISAFKCMQLRKHGGRQPLLPGSGARFPCVIFFFCSPFKRAHSLTESCCSSFFFLLFVRESKCLQWGCELAVAKVTFRRGTCQASQGDS